MADRECKNCKHYVPLEEINVCICEKTELEPYSDEADYCEDFEGEEVDGHTD